MSCTHPCRIFPTGYLTENGKPEYFYTQRQDTFIPPSSLEKKWPERKWLRGLDEFIEVPCGHCPQCKEAYVRAWSMRMVAESLMYKPEEIWFFTFTYAKEPRDPLESKKDFSDFMRRLRDFMKHDKRIRFFAVGEHGEEKGRVHVHAVLFGINFKKWFVGAPYDSRQFSFPMIEKLWNHGFCPGSMCNGVDGIAGYVMKYLLKDKDLLIWKQASLKPGLGFGYLEKLALEMDPEAPSACIVPNGRGRAVLGAVPKALRQRLGISSLLIQRGSYVKLFNKMIAAGYSKEEAVRYSYIEAYRESQERLLLDKKAYKSFFK